MAATRREKMNVEIITKETIKPSSPTPSHLRTFNLSVLDQTSPPIYSPLLLFYANNCDRERPHRSKKSLSEFLTRFYPVAGRFREHNLLVVDCNDEGVFNLEGRVNRSLSEALEEPASEELKKLIPTEYGQLSVGTSSPLLLVQSSFFECGGVALALSLSHKIGDASTIRAVAKSRASACCSGGGVGCPADTVVPDFSASSLFPALRIDQRSAPKLMTNTSRISRRLVFEGSKISQVRAKAAGAGVSKPARLEAVSALLWKCSVAANRARLGHQRPSVTNWTVNIRPRIVPSLSEHSFGNLFVRLRVQAEENYETDLPGLVGCLRKKMTQLEHEYVKKLRGDGENLPPIPDLMAQREGLKMKEREHDDIYTHGSWRRFRLYDVDFSWGKPAWVKINDALNGFPNSAVFVDTSDGEGIEAWVNLVEEDAALFERDPVLLACI